MEKEGAFGNRADFCLCLAIRFENVGRDFVVLFISLFFSVRVLVDEILMFVGFGIPVKFEVERFRSGVIWFEFNWFQGVLDFSLGCRVFDVIFWILDEIWATEKTLIPNVW